MLPSQLIELGEQALHAVQGSVAHGGPLVRCQLLASEFYEALKRELHETRADEVANRDALIAATIQCHRSAKASLTPASMLAELRGAIAILKAEDAPPRTGRPRPRPILRVIEGGLSGR